MKINSVNSTSFTGWTAEAAKESRKLMKEAKALIKEPINAETADAVSAKLSAMDKKLKTQLDIAKKDIDKNAKPVEGIWVGIVKAIEKLTGGPKSTGDVASALTAVVLWGNVLKEAVGTALYTIQAMTNEDLPKDKRRFVGAYDLGVGVTSTMISFILGVGFQKVIEKGYKSMLKGLKGSSPRYDAILAGLSSFTSFGLQTIVGKRMIAPLVGVPVAGKIRSMMEARDAKKNGAISMQGNAAEDKQVNDVKTEEFPTIKSGYVDLKTYVARIKEQQAKEAEEINRN